MPRKAWSSKRERQYEHIRDSYEDRGIPEDEAEERAARTVNKERRRGWRDEDSAGPKPLMQRVLAHGPHRGDVSPVATAAAW